MNAKTEAARDATQWSDGEAGSRRRGAPMGLLGFAALGLWVLAVCLGIGAPLLGIDLDARLVLAVLVASGVVSLLSLPVTACAPDAVAKKAERAPRKD